MGDVPMKKLLLASAAVSTLFVAGPTLSADLPLAGYPVVVVPPFTWTSCYLGAHLGGGWARKQVTDPVQLVQDSFLGVGTTVGVTTADATPSGIVVGGQLGCDYQFPFGWVIGVEGAVSGSTMKGNRTLPLPLGNPGENELVAATNDFIPSVTGRVGYGIDRVLLYGKGGVAWAGDKYRVTGNFQGTPFGFEGLDNRIGWTAGAGIEWAFSRQWSVSVEYDYYNFGHKYVLMSDSINVLSGYVGATQSVQIVKAGLNFHIWAFDR